MQSTEPADHPCALVDSVGTSFTRLPVPLTSLLARDREIADVGALLGRPDVRLLTLTGPGGVGKTRLAIAVANAIAGRYDHRVAFGDLAPLRDMALVPAAIAHAFGVTETGDLLSTAIASALGPAHLLLVLDNVEHLLEAAPFVAELLSVCSGLAVLATSRAALRVSGEQEYPVAPLPVSRSTRTPDDARLVPAVQLFAERATAVDPGFRLTEENVATVVAICARLDGLPLALELAAAQSKVLPPSLLLSRLARQLPLLTGGPRDAPARLRTMVDAITWSHNLLPPPRARASPAARPDRPAPVRSGAWRGRPGPPCPGRTTAPGCRAPRPAGNPSPHQPTGCQR